MVIYAAVRLVSFVVVDAIVAVVAPFAGGRGVSVGVAVVTCHV